MVGVINGGGIGVVGVGVVGSRVVGGTRGIGLVGSRERIKGVVGVKGW